MNLSFLRSMQSIWKKHGLLSDTMNLDFTAIPYWGDDSHLENNWSGKRSKAKASILAVLGQDPDSGIIDYSDTTIRPEDQGEVVLEFLDFYREGKTKGKGEDLKYLVVDFDLTMTVLAHNLYRLLAMNLHGYTHNASLSLYEKFLYNSGEVEIRDDTILVKMKKKRNLPALLSEMEKFKDLRFPWMNNKRLIFSGASTT